MNRLLKDSLVSSWGHSSTKTSSWSWWTLSDSSCIYYRGYYCSIYIQGLNWPVYLWIFFGTHPASKVWQISSKALCPCYR